MTPTPSPAEALEHAVFMALMWAMSHPGKAQLLEGKDGLEDIRIANSAMPSLESVGKALLDLETSFYTPDPQLHQRLIRLGAQAQGPQKAVYQFYLQPGTLEAIAQAPIGTLVHPETGATLVLGCTFEQGVRLRLSGPGIHSVREVEVDLPKDFWNLRNERVSFPLGWDIFLVSGSQIVGIPRSTHVEVI